MKKVAQLIIFLCCIVIAKAKDTEEKYVEKYSIPLGISKKMLANAPKIKVFHNHETMDYYLVFGKHVASQEPVLFLVPTIILYLKPDGDITGKRSILRINNEIAPIDKISEEYAMADPTKEETARIQKLPHITERKYQTNTDTWFDFDAPVLFCRDQNKFYSLITRDLVNPSLSIITPDGCMITSLHTPNLAIPPNSTHLLFSDSKEPFFLAEEYNPETNSSSGTQFFLNNDRQKLDFTEKDNELSLSFSSVGNIEYVKIRTIPAITHSGFIKKEVSVAGSSNKIKMQFPITAQKKGVCTFAAGNLSFTSNTPHQRLFFGVGTGAAGLILTLLTAKNHRAIKALEEKQKKSRLTIAEKQELAELMQWRTRYGISAALAITTALYLYKTSP